MTYHGKVSKGTIVLDGQPELPEGAWVSVEVTLMEPGGDQDDTSLAEGLLKLAGSAGEGLPADDSDADADAEALAQDLLGLAGTCEGLPADYSLQHDHYLYGIPKR